VSLFTPASVGWFLMHELRLSWRYMVGRSGGKTRGLVIGFIILGVVALAIGAPVGFLSRMLDLEPLPPTYAVGIDMALAFMGTIMLAQTLGTATLVFHDRGDLDLLLASPVRPNRILAVRKVVMAFNAMITFLLLVTPFLITAALIGGHWGWLASYPVLISLAMIATTIGLSTAFGLFRILGPRRTRTVAQILGAVIGVSIFMVSQSYNLMGRDRSRMVWSDLGEWMDQSNVGPLAALPARAVLGHPTPLVIVVVFALGLFALSAQSLGRRFAHNAALVAGAGEPVRKVRRRSTSGFRGGVMRTLVVKELKLLWRDPALISQVLLQVLYLVPVTAIILRSAARGGDGLLNEATMVSAAGIFAFLAGQIAAGLGWLTISAEDAPELLACAPVAPRTVARAKILAVVIPVAGLLVAPCLALAGLAPWVAFSAFLGACICAATLGYVELWTQKKGKRSQFRMRRKGAGAIWVALLELLICALFGAVVSLFAAKLWLTIIPAIVLLIVILPLKKDKWLTQDD
jgi:ABC-2 type transport system permease protein